MYSRTLSILSFSCVAAIALYLVGIATTVFFATWQTGLARTIQETEGSVTVLETDYYKAVEKYSDADPVAAGFTHPRTVQYVTEAGVAVLSRADQ